MHCETFSFFLSRKTYAIFEGYRSIELLHPKMEISLIRCYFAGYAESNHQFRDPLKDEKRVRYHQDYLASLLDAIK